MLVGAPTETSGLDNTSFNLSVIEGRGFVIPQSPLARGGFAYFTAQFKPIYIDVSNCLTLRLSCDMIKEGWASSP